MKYPDGQHCPADLVSQMKHSLRQVRSDVVALFLVAVGTILCCRTAVRRADYLAGRPPQLLDEAEEMAAAVAASPPPPPLNASLMRLASVNPMRRELEQLVEGSFTMRDPLYRSFASWLRFHHHSEHAKLQHDRRMQSKSVLRDTPGRLLRSPRDYRVFPELRRVAREWLSRRRFHPDVMSQLVDLVKRPLDLHNAALRSGEEPSSSTAGHAPAGRYGSCAVVGNSGILLNSERGHLIDGHDLVIRLNNARTAGFERNVGSRTGLAFINSNILHLCARRETCFCHPYGEQVPIIMYICQAAHFLDFTLCNASHKAPLLVTDPHFDRLCARVVKYYSLKRFAVGTGKPPEEWDNAHDAKMFHYSSGMQAVVLALGICDRVSIFGFGKSPEAKHHYHTKQKAELTLHDYDAEYAFYRDLIERPQVMPLLLESRFRVPPVVMYQ